MILEPQRRCHKFQVMLPSSTPESSLASFSFIFEVCCIGNHGNQPLFSSIFDGVKFDENLRLKAPLGSNPSLLEPWLQRGFQLFVSGDGCGRCLHPDRADASVHEFHRLLGPDDNPQGHGWSIGKHTQELGLGCCDSCVLRKCEMFFFLGG